MYMLWALNATHGTPSLPPPQFCGSAPTSGAQSSYRNLKRYLGIVTAVRDSVCNSELLGRPLTEGTSPRRKHSNRVRTGA
jgi:hypothetical protein